MADALFTINGDSSNQGFDAAPSQVLTLQLKTLPVSGVSSVRFQVWDASAFDPDEDILVNPPRKAKDSPALTLVGASSGPSVAPAGGVNGTVQVTMPSSDGHAWIVRCVVNGGKSDPGDGTLVFDPRLVHERMIVIRDAATGGRPVVATETTQYEDDGWAPEVGRPGAIEPATGSADGFLQRIILTPADDGLTWNDPDDIPPGNALDFCGTGAGAGGRSGALNATNGSPISAQGGPGGGGGYRTPWFRFSRAFLIAQLPITFTIPSGGTGGAARSGTGVQNLAGALGSTPTGPTLMSGVNGVILRAFPGGLSSSANQAGAGGGAYSAGSGTAGGRPNDSDNGTTQPAYKTHGGCDRNTFLTTETSGAKQLSRYGGGGGGNSSSGGVSASCSGSESEFGGGGGGGAGGATAGTGAAQRAGAPGGGHDMTATGGIGTGGAAGAAGNLGHGSKGDDGDDHRAGKGGGSGGSSNNSGGAQAGNGGDGGDPGGGGGGGGAAANSFPGTTTNSSGAGGRGGHGEIRIIAWGPV